MIEVLPKHGAGTWDEQGLLLLFGVLLRLDFRRLLDRPDGRLGAAART